MERRRCARAFFSTVATSLSFTADAHAMRVKVRASESFIIAIDAKDRSLQLQLLEVVVVAAVVGGW